MRFMPASATFPVVLLVAASSVLAQKRLNNFVTELVNIQSPEPGEYAFEFPQEGWVFIRAVEGKAGAGLKLDDIQEPVISYAEGQSGTGEAMRYIKAGKHKVTLAGAGVGRLQIRKIPEIRYCKYQYDPWVIAYGPYNWHYLKKHILPHVNYRVFQDMEFHLLANDPEFDGLFGVMGYTSGYAEEETIRWLGKLYRHYCIEGGTERLTNEPYILNHLVNPDFVEDLKGWDTKPAEPGAITMRTIKGLGSQMGRYGSGSAGDKCVVMKRSAKTPNVVSQQIRNLRPGKLYALRMYSSSLKKASGYRNPTFDDYTTLNIRIDHVEIVPEKCFRHIYLAIHGKREDRMYFNYWFRVFRAKAGTARLTISDWKGPDDPFGNIGQETGFNFVEVQRYLEQ